ncbi:lactoylglutathione lyase [Thermoplasmatales archaeon SW_10_69_26]|nr:MAG: lactoylglutathione lyase [Thermoplasmatales archaeon SW_10_69_26]
MHLDHCCLNVRDMDRSIEFYRKHFDMDLLSRKEIPENDAEIAFVGYGEGGMKLELTDWKEWEEDDLEFGNNFDHIAVAVPDVTEWYEQLTDDGVESAMEPTELSTGSHIAFVKDVDGNWVELVQE